MGYHCPPRGAARAGPHMLKVLLAYRCPDEGFDDPRFAALPSGLPWLAASARESGAETTVANFSRLSWKDVERFVGELKPDLVGVSAWPANKKESGRLLRVCRKLAPESVLVAGGPIVDIRAHELLRRWGEADALIAGEGELAFGRLCAEVREAGREGIERVEGLVRRGEAGVRAAAPLSELDGLPAPRTDGALAGVDPQRDLRWVVATRPRGTALNPSPPALRSGRSIAKEVVGLRKRFGLVDFSLLGPGLVADRSLLPALAGELQAAKAGARWELTAELADLLPRSEPARDRALLRDALLDAAAAGCRRVRLCLESGSAAVTRRRQDLAAASETLRAAGLLPVLSLRVGDPELGAGEEIEELRGLVRALRPVECELEIRIRPEAAPAPEPAGGEEPEARTEDPRLRLERVAEALEPTLREARRSARPGPRELEARRVRGGGGAWLELDWGDYRAASGDPAEAERHYRAAAEIEPWSPHPWLRLAKLAARRDGEGEVAALREVLHRVPEHGGARERLEELRRERPRARRGGRRRGGGKHSGT